MKTKPHEKPVTETEPFHVLVNRAQQASQSGDLAAAEQLWTSVLERQPEDPAGHIGLAALLNRQKKPDAADAIIREALSRFPDNMHVIANHAWLAHDRGDWQAALARWTIYRAQFPDDPLGFSAPGVALRHLQRYDEADAILTEGLRRHPEHGELLGNYAWVAHDRSDWPEALTRWTNYKEKFPEHGIGYSSLGVVLRKLERFDEADDVLRKGLQFYPDDPELIGNHAWVAYDRHDWPEALRRWENFRDRSPREPLGHRQVMLVLGELGRFEEAEALSRPAALRQANNTELTSLMLEFESLGDNCEFGVVQRYYGAEPLGLLRFTATPPQLLTAALLNRFAGVGAPENTTLHVYNDEYLTNDTRYHMAMHTFIRAGNDDREKRFVNICRRLEFLREKLIRDLELSEKHFVYGCRHRLPDSEIVAMWQAMRRYGQNRLLFVHPANETELPGTTRLLERDLIIGCLDRLSVEQPSFDLWFHLCRQAHDYWSNHV
jgi:Flp pilus assembly protein TadD